MTHIPGKFVWFELVTKDAKRAQAFYGEVLGWKVESAPMGDFTYDMIKVGDKTIGGYAQPQGEPPPGLWTSYVSVADVDAAGKAAVAAGGKALGPAFDIPTVGRTQKIHDPIGAEVNLFHSSNGDPEDVKRAPEGHFFWNELQASEPERAVAFYTKVLGYTDKPMSMGADTYHVIEQSGEGRGGIMKAHKGAPNHWLPYVHVADCDATLARAVKHGAKELVAATDIPGIGRYAIFRDPVGGVLAIMKPAPMP